MGDNNYQNMLNRLIEEKYTFNYKKLVVPMSMRSPYWKYFGFPATEDGNILTKVKIICILCKTQIAYNKNTSNLRMHLQNRHASELAELVSVHPPENRPSVKGPRPNQFQLEARQVKSVQSSGNDQKSPRKRKFHRMLENTNSGFIKQGAGYATPADGSIEIEGDLQFISDPTINIASFTDEEFSNPMPSIEIVGAASSSNPMVVVDSAHTAQASVPAAQSANRIRIEGQGVPSSAEERTYEIDLSGSLLSQMSSVESRTVCDAITDMIITDLTPPDIVEKPGFQRLVATLRSPCEIPSTARLVNEILPALYSQVKERNRETLDTHQKSIGLSLEEWVSREGHTMVTVSAHFVHKSNLKLESRVLRILHSPYDATHNWNTDVDAIFAEWQIDASRVTAMVAACGQQRLLDVFTNKGITVVPCLLYSIQVVAQMCFEKPEVSILLGKVRALINAFKSNLDDESTLRIQDQEFHLEEPLVLDYPPVWLSTYHMIEQIQMFRTLVPTVLESGSENLKEFWLLDEDWDLLEELLGAMEPLRVAVLTLAEEKAPLLSLLEPLLWQLVDSHLQLKEEDSVFVQSLKRTISDQLSNRYSDYSCKMMLRTATQLDPRFKSLPHNDQSLNNAVVDLIHKTLESNIEETGAQKEVVPTPSKKNRLSGLLGKLCPDKTSSERAKNELEHFKSVTSAALDACPLEWWSGNAAVCPSLVNVARRYLCLLACATPLHRIPYPQQSAFHQASKGDFETYGQAERS